MEQEEDEEEENDVPFEENHIVIGKDSKINKLKKVFQTHLCLFSFNKRWKNWDIQYNINKRGVGSIS